jgi:hypothetical protein
VNYVIMRFEIIRSLALGVTIRRKFIHFYMLIYLFINTEVISKGLVNIISKEWQIY